MDPRICIVMPGLSRSGRVDALSGGVLSIGKLAAGQEAYYLSAVADGAEEYYLGAGEVPGYWIGTVPASSASTAGERRRVRRAVERV